MRNYSLERFFLRIMLIRPDYNRLNGIKAIHMYDILLHNEEYIGYLNYT